MVLRVLRRMAVTATLAVVITVVLSAVVPGGMQLVASRACPEGTTDSFVVRQPHDPNPVRTVRTYSLVCVGAEGAPRTANTVTVLALLFAGTLPVLFVLSLPLSLLTRPRLPAPGSHGPPPRRFGIAREQWSGSAFMAGFGLAMGLPFTIAGAAMTWMWLALDMPYKVEACGSGSDRGTCYEGESVNRLLALLFLGLGLFFVALSVAARWRRRRRTHLEHLLWNEGRRTTGVVVSEERTSAKIRNGRVYRYEVEVQPPDGGPPFTVTDRGLPAHGIAPGTKVGVIYDPVDTSRAVITGVAPPSVTVGERDEAPPERGLV